jgi:dienelactone hydrolase
MHWRNRLAPAVLLAILPGTAPWDFPKDIVAEQYRELKSYFERKLSEAAAARSRYWQSDSQQENREELRRLLGANDPLLAPKPELKGLGETAAHTVSLVEWPILRLGNSGSTGGFSGAQVRECGVLLIPKSTGKHAATIALADADQPAAVVATPGEVTFSPFYVRRRTFSLPWTEDRRWLFRLGYQVGRHLIGAEVQQVSSAYDFLASLPEVDPTRIGVAGWGQGGVTALYAAALDLRLASARVVNYLGRSGQPWEEPEDRMIWRIAERFGDSEIASLVRPRPLVIENGPPPDSEFPVKVDSDLASRISNAQFAQWQARFRNLAMESYAIRETAWRADTSSPEAFARWRKAKQELYLDTTGRFPAPGGSLDARSVRIYDEPKFTGYRLSVGVYEGVHAYGILLVPKNLRPGEKRAVVFTQHGLAGTPEDALGVVANAKADAVYQRFGLRLAERGYIVFAPMISVQVETERYQVVRRAHLLGMTPAGIEAKKFSRVIDFLETLPFVDKDRIGFYGLSYGGYTALWAPPAEPRFRVVVSSGHFNDWTLKTTDLTEGTSFLFYKNALDMFQFGVLNKLTHSELMMLLAPRPVMIELGDQDGIVISPRRFADIEMQRVEDLYRRLGIPEKGRVSRFDGPHRIDGAEAFPFLDRWLK